MNLERDPDPGAPLPGHYERQAPRITMTERRSYPAGPTSDLVIRVMTGGSVKIRLFLILVIAAALRLAATIAISSPQQVPRSLAESDAPTYYVLADHMIDGTGYRYAADQPPTAKRTPGYPLFLAAIFKLSGRSFSAVRVAQCALDVMTTYLVFALTVLLVGSRPAGLLAALVYAIYPPAIMSSTYIMTETLYTLLLVLAILATCYAFKLRSTLLCAASGVGLALSTLTRPGAFLLPFAFLAIGLVKKLTAAATYERGVGRVLGARYERGRGMGGLVGLVVLCVAFCAMMLPWVLRNERALGAFIPTSTLMGANLYKGNDLATRGAYFASTDSLLTPDLRAKLAGVGEVERDRMLGAEARHLIFTHKHEALALTIEKLPRLWLNLGYGRAPSKKSLAIAVTHLALIVLALYGALWVPPEARALGSFPATTIIFSSLMYLTVASEVRFVFPLIPLLLPYSAWGIASIGRAVLVSKARV
jgi:Dolichyl-phosphate-mannose-protein mannosyltransferase